MLRRTEEWFMNAPARGIPLRPDRDAMFAEERQSWGRALAALVIANREHAEPAAVLKATWPDDRATAIRLKAATSPTSTGNAPALLLDVVQAFRSLAPASAALALFEKGLQVDLRGVNMITLPSLANVPPPGVFVAEGAPAPNLQFHFGGGAVLGPTRKILLLAAASGELESAVAGTMSAVLGKVLSDTAARGLDAAAFGTQAADDTVPQGFLHGVTPVAAAAAGADAMVQDIAALLHAIAVSNIDMTGAVFIAGAAEVGILKTKVGPRFDYSLLSTLALPAKTVVCVAPAAVASAYADPPQIEVLKIPAVHFEGSDPLPIASPGSPPTVAAPVYSHFQADMISLKCRARCAWAVLPGGASFVSGINW
jgi:hypothetical protein